MEKERERKSQESQRSCCQLLVVAYIICFSKELLLGFSEFMSYYFLSKLELNAYYSEQACSN